MQAEHDVRLFALQKRDEPPAAKVAVGQHDLFGRDPRHQLPGQRKLVRFPIGEGETGQLPGGQREQSDQLRKFGKKGQTLVSVVVVPRGGCGVGYYAIGSKPT